MSLSVNAESFVNPTSSLTNTNLPTSGSLGYTPKALLLLGTLHTADGDAGGVNFGFSTSSAEGEVAMSTSSQAAATTPTVVRARAQQTASDIIRTPSATSAATRLAHILTGSGWADPIVIDWDTVSATQYYHHGLVLGGDGVSAKAGQVFIPAQGGTGDTSVGFTPTVVLFYMTVATTTYPYTTANSNTSTSFGILTADSQYCSGFRSSDNVNPTDNARRQTSNYVLWTGTTTTDSVKVGAEIISGGFRLSSTTASAQYAIHYLALAGVSAKCGTITQPAATGIQSTSGVGFTPKLLLTLSNATTSGTGLTDHTLFSLGWALSSTNRVGMGLAAKDNNDTTVADNYAATYMSRSHIVCLRDNNTTTTTSALGMADLDAFNSDGFSLDWESTDGTGREIIYLALGDGTPSNGLTQVIYDYEGN